MQKQYNIDTLIIRYNTASDFICIDEDAIIRCLLPCAVAPSMNALIIYVGVTNGCGSEATYFPAPKSNPFGGKNYVPFNYIARIPLKEGQFKEIHLISGKDRFYIDQKWLASNVTIKMHDCTGSDYGILGKHSKKITVQSNNGKKFSE